MRAERIVETCLYAEDLTAARAFYVKVLGCEPFAEIPGRHLFFRCGRGVFLLFNPEATRVAFGDIPAHGAKGQGHVAFMMEEANVDATRTWLEKDVGAEIESVYAWPNGGTSLYFRDPAGNSLEFTTLKTWGIEV